jgi:hypothetical protein
MTMSVTGSLEHSVARITCLGTGGIDLGASTALLSDSTWTRNALLVDVPGSYAREVAFWCAECRIDRLIPPKHWHSCHAKPAQGGSREQSARMGELYVVSEHVR